MAFATGKSLLNDLRALLQDVVTPDMRALKAGQDALHERMDRLEKSVAEQTKALREEMAEQTKTFREQMVEQSKTLRLEIAEQFKTFRAEMNLRFDRIDERDRAFKQDFAEFKDLVDRRFSRLESAFDTYKDVQELKQWKYHQEGLQAGREEKRSA